MRTALYLAASNVARVAAWHGRLHVRSVALAALVLSACAGPTFVYERRGTTPARTEHDLADCRKEAFRPGRFAIRQSQRYDQDALTRCMERKGYAVRRAG